MKKILAVVLGILMLVSVLPVAVSGAESYDYTESADFESADDFNANTRTIIKSGAEMTIPDEMEMTIEQGKTVRIEAGATLIVLGTLTVEKGAVLEVKGTVVHSERVTVLGSAPVTYKFENTRLKTLGSHLASVYAAYSNDGSSYADVSENVTWSSNLVSGGEFTAPLNSYVYIRTVFNQPTVAGYEKAETAPTVYDNTKLKVYADGIELEVKQGSRIFQATTAASITYSDWNDTDYLYDYKFYVPDGAGYTVHGTNGETSAYGAIKVPAGSDFRFRIEVDGDYDMSKYELYYWEGYTFDSESGQDKIDNGDAKLLTADSDGYYTISSVYTDNTIYVTGIVSNETIETASSILDILRNALNVIKTFFERIFGLFGKTIEV